MCCAPREYTEDQIDGKCPDCKEPTVEGDAYEACGYSPILCNKCGDAPCDGSC